MGEEGVGALNPCSIKQDNKPDNIRLISKQKRKAISKCNRYQALQNKLQPNKISLANAKLHQAQNAYPGSFRRLSMKRDAPSDILGQRTPYRIYFNHPHPECQDQMHKISPIIWIHYGKETKMTRRNWSFGSFYQSLSFS